MTQLAQRISPSEGAREVGVSRSTIHRWIRSGELPAYRVGRKLLRIDPAELSALVARVYHP